jgi:hypothetical protein
LRLLTQNQAGIDLAAGLLYRRDRYTPDDGLVQAVLAIARHWGRVGLFGNLAYGQDMEGDDRDGELSLALLYERSVDLQLGFESHLRFDLSSEDPRRQMRGQGPFDLQLGPLAHYCLGSVIVTAQAGLSALKAEQTRTGVICAGRDRRRVLNRSVAVDGSELGSAAGAYGVGLVTHRARPQDAVETLRVVLVFFREIQAAHGCGPPSPRVSRLDRAQG